MARAVARGLRRLSRAGDAAAGFACEWPPRRSRRVGEPREPAAVCALGEARQQARDRTGRAGARAALVAAHAMLSERAGAPGGAVRAVPGVQRRGPGLAHVLEPPVASRLRPRRAAAR